MHLDQSLGQLASTFVVPQVAAGCLDGAILHILKGRWVLLHVFVNQQGIDSSI
jgi:hypothetical protein